MTDCIFCRIAAKEIPADIVLETDDCLVFLDNTPTAEGHVLVVPKEHYDGFADTPAEVAGQLIGVAQRAARAATAAVGATAFNTVINTGKEAGQVVFHTHIHIIPRKTGDGLVSWHGKTTTAERLREIATAIREKL